MSLWSTFRRWRAARTLAVARTRADTAHALLRETWAREFGDSPDRATTAPVQTRGQSEESDNTKGMDE